MPVFNTDETLLLAAINSALRQTLEKIEVIIVDNGSDDSTLNTLKKIVSSNKKAKLFVESNGRQGKARNVGMQHVKGEYIAFLDSDDLLLPETLEKLHLQATNNSLDILKSDFYTLLYPEKRQELTRISTDGSWYNRVFDSKTNPDLLNQIPYLWNGLYKTEFLRHNNISFNDDLVNEDHLFCWQANMFAEKISFTREAGIYYRKNYGSESSKSYINSIDLLKIYDKIEEFLVKNNFYEKYNCYYLKSKIRDFFYMCTFNNCPNVNRQYLSSLKKNIQDVPSRPFSRICNNELITLYYLAKYIDESCWVDYISSLSNKSENETNYLMRLEIFLDSLLYVLKCNPDKKFCLYGAGTFANNLAEKFGSYHFSNIIGYIDKNPELTGKKLSGYTIYHPTSVKKLKPDIIIPVLQNPTPVLGFIENMKFFYSLDFKVVTF